MNRLLKQDEFTAKRQALKSGLASQTFDSSPLPVSDPTFNTIFRKASCACGGGCPSCQAKSGDLKVSQPNDPAEIEADQVADKVMRTANMGGFQPNPNSESMSPAIQAKSYGGGGVSAGEEIGSRIHSSRGGGSSLDAATRGFMESRFGADLGEVRIHTGNEAAGLNRELNAKAFTVGHDIFFDHGQYQPATESGKHLIAHELAHTRQQAASAGRIQRVVTEHSEEDHSTHADAIPETKKVCLTYDDGPEDGTKDVLDALGGTIPATFFLTGKNMQSDPVKQKELVERTLSEGHQIGNHTLTHSPETKGQYKNAYGDLSDPAKLKAFQENFTKNEDYFKTLLGKTDPLFSLARLPGDGRAVQVGGKFILIDATQAMGMRHFGWQFEFSTNGTFAWVPINDWRKITGVAATFTRLPNNADVILFHDRHWKGKASLLTAIFTELKTNGFTFGKLDSSGNCS